VVEGTEIGDDRHNKLMNPLTHGTVESLSVPEKQTVEHHHCEKYKNHKHGLFF
jgi:hypothetical protein